MAEIKIKQRAEILLKRLIDQAETELKKLEKYESIDYESLQITMGKIIAISAQLDVKNGNADLD